MLLISCLILLVFGTTVHSQSWNTTEGILPWESYLQLGDIQRPLGLTLNRSSPAHHHFAIGYLSLHSFMYEEAQDAFDLAIDVNQTFIEAYIGKMLGCKQAIWSYTNYTCGQETYNAAQLILNTTNITLSYLQSSLLSTVYQWYANESDTTAGELAFLSSIANLSQTYPNETDILVLWGLSLLNVADESQFQDEMEPDQMVEARNKLEMVLMNEPNHPGALHYLIHAYDVAQVNISAQAAGYASLYGNIVTTASHAQHMPAHIWMRTGLWNRALSADSAAIIASLNLCATKLFRQNMSVASTELESVLSLSDTTCQTSLILSCDAENRAHSTEWLSYSRLQTGNWAGSVALLRDLIMADDQSTLTPNHYLPFAYRTQARTIVELFFWFPYSPQFLNRTQQLITLYGTQTLVPVDDNVTRWYPIWSEAGFRFSQCLQLLAADNTSSNTSVIDDHLNRLLILSTRTSSLNQYISTSISMMISQIRGIRYYLNQSWQECLNELNNATQREATLVADANSPTLIFARSSELLAMHLLLIYTKLKTQTAKSVMPTYVLNGTNVSMNEFPTRALVLYQTTNSVAPNRSINILGMARANIQIGNNTEAVRLYQVLLTQVNSSANSDPIFSQEAVNNTVTYNSTATTGAGNYSTTATTAAGNYSTTATTTGSYSSTATTTGSYSSTATTTGSYSSTTTTTGSYSSTTTTGNYSSATTTGSYSSATTTAGNYSSVTTTAGTANSATTNKHLFLSTVFIFCITFYY